MMESNLSFFELVLGESGSGKTFLIKEICKNDKSCLYVKARRSLSAAAFLSLIIRAMGEKPKGNSDEKLEMIFELLRQKDIKMLFVDEADLFVRDNDYTFERKFELLREIYEYSKMNNLGITVISVGLNELKRRIDKLGGYLKSRLTYSPEVSFNTQELKKIAALNGICDDENTVFLCEKNNARVFEKVAINMALGYDEKTSINLLYANRKNQRSENESSKFTSKRIA